jgi:hypothetical protein
MTERHKRLVRKHFASKSKKELLEELLRTKESVDDVSQEARRKNDIIIDIGRAMGIPLIWGTDLAERILEAARKVAPPAVESEKLKKMELLLSGQQVKHKAEKNAVLEASYQWHRQFETLLNACVNAGIDVAKIMRDENVRAKTASFPALYGAQGAGRIAASTKQ